MKKLTMKPMIKQSLLPLLILSALSLATSSGLHAQTAASSQPGTAKNASKANKANSASNTSANADSTAEQQIRQLIGKTYDQADKKVETAPISIVNDYALADWIQGEKGGRALLQRKQGEWQILACGGDGFKQARHLQQTGMPAATAQQLVKQLEQAEQALPPARVKQFGLFDANPATKHGAASASHH
ncbi:MAG: hypothetical protein RL748_974 [Pseudomonadota bacterium]|jgi:hypothetical protein